MSTRLSALVARFVLLSALLAAWVAPAAALEVKPVPSVYGMAPKAALDVLERAGFTTFELRLDGAVKTRAEVEGAAAVATWTAPPEWESSDTGAVLGVGFETKVRVADHIGQTGGFAKEAAARIGYVLCEGDPAASTPIPDGDTRIVESYHPSSPPPGTLVSVGAYVGVILVAPSSPSYGLAGSLIAGAVAGAAVAGVILMMKGSKAKA